MPMRRSKYSATQNSELTFETMTVLSEAQEALTIEEICNRSIKLTGHTPQKMARILNDLVDVGMVKKCQSKSKGRMIYKSTAVMAEQGYDVE